MHTQSLRWIGSAMIVAALAAAPLVAQAPSPPQVTVTGSSTAQTNSFTPGSVAMDAGQGMGQVP